MIVSPSLLSVPMVSLEPITVSDANRLLVRWEHKLGEIHRPFRTQAFALLLDGEPISVMASASVVSATVAGYKRTEVVECARLCSRSDLTRSNRIALRLWREVCAPRWPDWPVKAAVSYSHNAMHRGQIYRLDGWKLVKDDCGSSGGGAWSRKRYATDAVHGKKSLWLWEYQREEIAALQASNGYGGTEQGVRPSTGATAASGAMFEGAPSGAENGA